MADAGRLRTNLGGRIRLLRKARGWTQQELANEAELDYKYIGAVERGERNLTLDNVGKIAAGLGVEVHQLFLFTQSHSPSREQVNEEKIRDLLANADPSRKDLMWRVLREIGT